MPWAFKHFPVWMRHSLFLLVTLVAALSSASCQFCQKIGGKMVHEIFSAAAEVASDELSNEKKGIKTEIKLGADEDNKD